MSEEIDYYNESLKLCKGCYQRNLIYGSETWSGSSLKGKANKYGAHYAKSRRRLIERLMDHDLAFLVVGERGKIELRFGEPKSWYQRTTCAAGPAWRIPKPEELPALLQLAMAGEDEGESRGSGET